jgi:hypothetical protein
VPIDASGKAAAKIVEADTLRERGLEPDSFDVETST